ncbi:MAG: cytidine deaminase [Fimbriimonadaceae bacterium]|nr:cytidine deaminase [Fimbriimonadaceae bacterium]
MSEKLLLAARAAQLRAYCPYSGYQVGAAVEDAEGRIYAGSNIENQSYGATVCAERVALWNMVAAGSQQWVRLAVVTKDGGTPCGLCLQVMSEFAANDEVEVVIATPEEQKRILTLHDLMPIRFESDEVQRSSQVN